MLRSVKRNGNGHKPTGLGRTASAKLNEKHLEDDLKPIHLTSAADEVTDVKTLKKPLPKPTSIDFQRSSHYEPPAEDRMAITLEKFASDPQNKVLSCLYGLAA